MTKNQKTHIIDKESENKAVFKMSAVGIAGNIILAAFKFVAGIAGHSGAMISDAIHSSSDVFATFIAFIGVRISKKGADDSHEYGHERVECIASLALGVILLVTGITIGKNGIESIISGSYKDQQSPGSVALIAAVFSIVAKEAMYWYTRYYAKLLNSSAFMADAWHHRSDAFSSVGSLIGIIGAMLGYPVMDCIASVVICAFILKVAIEIIVDALRKMLDTSCGEEYEEQIRKLVLAQGGVSEIDLLKTRQFGNKIYVDLEIAVDGQMSLYNAHAIAENVHDSIEKAFADVKHVMIHVNPAEKK